MSLRSPLLLVLPLLVACGAGGGSNGGAAGSPYAADGGASGAAGNGSLGLGGAAGGAPIDLGLAGAVATHPLFGAGNSPGIDLTNPCNTSQIWEIDMALRPAVNTGSKVVYDGKLWELTGQPSNTETGDAWALPACTPPGTDWCATQYAWEELQTCE